MGNQNFGDFAGAFADSFTRTLNAKRDGQRKDKFAKLQAQLVELQLGNAKTVEEAQTLVKKMMGGSLEEFQPAAPIQTPGGRDIPQFSNASRKPMSLTEMLSSGEGTNALMQSGMVTGGDILDSESKSAMLAQTQQIMDQYGIGGGAGGGAGGAGDMVLSGVGFGPRGAEFSLAPNPATSPMGSGEASLYVDANGEPMMPGLSPQQVTQRGGILKTVYDARIRVKEVGRDSSVKFAQTKKAYKLMGDLEDTLIRSGTPGGELIRNIQAGGATVGNAFGLNTSGIKANTDKRDELGKILAGVMLSGKEIDDLAEAGVISQQKWKSLKDAAATLDKGMIPVTGILLDSLEARIASNDFNGIETPDRDEMLSFIRKTRAEINGQPVPEDGDAPAVIDDITSAIDGIRTLGLDRLSAVGEILANSPNDPNVVRLQEEVDKRYSALVGSAKEIREMGEKQFNKWMDQYSAEDIAALPEDVQKAAKKRWDAGADEREKLARKASSSAAKAVNVAKDVWQMGDDQFNKWMDKLDEEDIQALPEKVRDAAQKRWEELNGD